MSNMEVFDRPGDIVDANMGAMNARADEALTKTYEVIASLGDEGLELPPAPSLPSLPDVNVPSPVRDPVPPSTEGFGEVSAFSAPSYDDLSAYLALSLEDLEVDIPEFSSSVGTFVMPTRPSPIDTSGLPTAPVLDAVSVPASPTVTMPTVPTLVELAIPEFTFPEIDEFTAVAPTFDGVAPTTNLSWSEPTYVSDLMDELVAKVRSWLQGGTGLPPAIQQALFDAARGRVSLVTTGEEQAAFDAWAGRGFSMPPGMLVAQVNAARDKGRLDQLAAQRDLTVKLADVEIENLRFAMERGIAIEGLLMKVFSDSASRSFEAAKFAVDSEMKLYDVSVALFNAKQNAYQVAATVFKTKLDAKLAELDVFKAEVEGEIAKGQVNESRVRSYEAQVKGVMSVVDLFKVQMEGARVAQEVNKGRLEAYKSDIDAYSARLGADKTRFEAYEAEVRGEAARAGAFESEARAYAETVRAIGERSNLKVKYVDAKIAGVNASVNKFQALTQASAERVRATAAAVQARAQAFTADVGRYTAEIQGKNVSIEAGLRVQEMRLRNLLAHSELQVKEYDAMATRVIQSAQVISDRLKAAGQFTSALATGAMSAIRVSSSIAATGQVEDRNSYNVNINRRGADAA